MVGIKIKQKIIKYIPFLIIFMRDLFFILSEVFGYRYEGSDSSVTYYIYTILMFFSALVLFLHDLVLNGTKLSKKNIMVISVSMVVIALFLFEILFNQITKSMLTSFLFFILWGFSSILMGIYLSKYDRYKNIVGFIEILNLLINIALIRSVLTSIIYSERVTLGGATYQQAGYVYAFGFGINLFMIIYGKKFERPNFTSKKSHKILNIIFLPIQVYGVIATGARGAMVLLIFNALIIFLLSVGNLKNTTKLLFVLSLFLIVLVISWPIISEIPIINNSWNRIFSYVSTQGINWNGTSGRDVVYMTSLTLINKKPILGYGLFNYINNLGYYPHNFFLEVLLQGGIVYLVIVIVLLYVLIRKFYIACKSSSFILIYLMIASYPMIMLMFSGTYMNTSAFWFIFSFIFSLTLETRHSSDYIRK